MKPSFPNLSNAVNAWAQPLKFFLVGKDQRDFMTEEVLYPKIAYGVRQPMKAQQLMMKPEGQRAWKWETIHSRPDLVLNIDDIVVFNEVRYRVMAKKDYSEYGYLEYEIMQDYQT